MDQNISFFISLMSNCTIFVVNDIIWFEMQHEFNPFPDKQLTLYTWQRAKTSLPF